MNFTKLAIILTCLGGLASILCSCTGTSVKQSSKAPDAQKPAGKIAVLTVDERSLLRQGFENRLVADLNKAGAQAFVTYELLSLPQIKEDKQGAASAFEAKGAGSILILRFVDAAMRYSETRPGGERYAGAITGFETTGWYDYFTIGFTDMSATYGNLKTKIYLETGLFDLKSGKRLWTATTETVLKEGTDRVAEMDPLTEKIVAAMRKDGMIP